MSRQYFKEVFAPIMEADQTAVRSPLRSRPCGPLLRGRRLWRISYSLVRYTRFGPPGS